MVIAPSKLAASYVRKVIIKDALIIYQKFEYILYILYMIIYSPFSDSPITNFTIFNSRPNNRYYYFIIYSFVSLPQEKKASRSKRQNKKMTITYIEPLCQNSPFSQLFYQRYFLIDMIWETYSNETNLFSKASNALVAPVMLRGLIDYDNYTPSHDPSVCLPLSYNKIYVLDCFPSWQLHQSNSYADFRVLFLLPRQHSINSTGVGILQLCLFD